MYNSDKEIKSKKYSVTKRRIMKQKCKAFTNILNVILKNYSFKQSAFEIHCMKESCLSNLISKTNESFPICEEK